VLEIVAVKCLLEYVLVIASSGRMLAQAAVSAKYRVLVVDLFSDQDTEQSAEQVYPVADLSLKSVQRVVKQIKISYKVAFVVYGSGLESQPKTLQWLSTCFLILGNKVEVIEQLTNLHSFFNRLDLLAIPYPDVSYRVPLISDDYLIKSMKSAGGAGVSFCNRKATMGEYYQKRIVGQVGSVLFCAQAKHVEVIGFHRQWTRAEHDFVFSGIIREQILPLSVQQQVHQWVEKLVAHYDLQGLVGLDFIWDGERCYFLEINARPPASMMLYPELDLFSAHTQRVISKISTAISHKIYALQIIYATQSCLIKPDFSWPKMSYDRPKATTKITKGEPICSIMASAATNQQALASLLEQQQIIENSIY